MTTDAVIIQTTVSTTDQAGALARALLDERVAACVQSSPIHSLYRWQGGVQNDPEIRLDIKTVPDRVDAAIRVIEAHHPYDTPEILVLPVAKGGARYLDWLRKETRVRSDTPTPV